MRTNRLDLKQLNFSEGYEELYFMLLEAIPSSVLLIDRNLRVISANRNFLKRGYLSESQALGRSLEELLPSVILDSIKLTDEIRKVFQGGDPEKGTRITYRAPGVPIRVYYYRLLPIIRDEVVEAVMLLMDDVTEQVRLHEKVGEVERHLASIVESAAEIIMSMDNEGRILTLNPAGQKILGYTQDELEGDFFHQHVAEEDRKAMVRVISDAKLGKKPEAAESDVVTKEAKSIHVSWVLSSMKDQQSRTNGILAVGRDLTQQRMLEAELFQSQKLAALGVMAGGIAHEIRNPLAICSSAAQFLMDDHISTEFRKECMNKIHASIHRASVTIDNVLRFARPGVTREFTKIDLSGLILETLALVDNQARIQKVKVKPHLPEDPVLITCIRSLIQQLLLNLFLNAIEAMPDGGVLSIFEERQRKEVSIRVTDTGHGIAGDKLDRVFDPFFTGSTAKTGAGLGLSISYSIVRQHSGAIAVDSTVGKGSTFTVRLPTLPAGASA